MAFTNCGLMSKKIGATTILETVYGTDPGSGYNAVLINTGASVKLENDMQERTMARPDFSPVGKISGAMSTTSTLAVELIGGGVDQSAKVVAPFYDDLMQASGLVKKTCYLLTCTGSTGSWVTTETVTQAATKAIHLGTGTLSSDILGV